jgi:hypothetical protein
MTPQNLLFFNKKGEQYKFQWNGEYWEGAVLFPKVSENLFEVEHIFVLEKFLNLSSQVEYGFPHSSYGGSPNTPIWRTRWESDYDFDTKEIDVTSIIYTYDLGVDDELDAPVLVKTSYVELYPPYVAGDAVDSPTGLVISNEIQSASMQINIALNSDTEGIYDRSLILEDYTDPDNPVTILKVSFHGEVEGEDSRLSVLLGNFGRKFLKEDSFISRETDIKEPLPDFEILNRKRKELLLTGESIYPYLGSYKSLFNAIKFFGYYDLRIKEYWLNIKKDEAETLTSLQQNNKVLKELSKKKTSGQNSLALINSILKDENEGKFKQVEIYGKKKDGTFGLKKQLEKIFPSKSYKKTALFGLFYDINEVDETQDVDQYGYPVVLDNFAFSPEEVLIKLFGLKERLKKDYLPLNARIIDITGEGVYFNVYKSREWTDQLGVEDVKSGIDVDFDVFPRNGYIDDLRPFYLKPNQNSILYPNINGVESGISYYNNTVEPYGFSQYYPIASVPSLITAIESFYDDVKNGTLPKNLGDGDFDPPGYKLFSNGNDHFYPAGCPIILKNNTFDITWDEISGSWDSLDPTITSTLLNVANYTSTTSPNPGTPGQLVVSSSTITIDPSLPQSLILNIGTGNDWFDTISPEVLFVRIESSTSQGNLILGYVNSGDYNTVTGSLTVQVISTRGSGTYSSWDVTPTNITFSNYSYDYWQNWVNAGGFYSWDRLPYLDFYEIEWKIFKEDDRPYYFEIRGGIPDLVDLPHFLPYTGKYTVQCRVWDTLNSISLGIKRSVIEVTGREVKLSSLTRYRMSEVYDWNNMPLTWDSYPGQWIWPVESQQGNLEISDMISNFPEYSNNFNEGQECEVLAKIPEVKATVEFDLGSTSYDIVDIVSPVITVSPGTSYDFAVVTTTAPHGYTSGQQVWIYDSVGSPYGNFPITVLSPTTFEIPQIVPVAITGGSVYGTGQVDIIADGVTIASSAFLGDINSTTSSLYAQINNSPLADKYKVITLVDSLTPDTKSFTLQAPNDKGSTWNGKIVQIQVTGSLVSTPSSVTFSGGVNETEEFVPFDPDTFTSYPVEIMRLWGTKNLTWDSFEDIEFDKAYAITWDMLDYHNDWLGGFSLYSLQYGDRIRVSSQTNGIVLGETDSPANLYLDLSEAAEQLKSSDDPNISRFDYVVRNYSELPGNYTTGGSSISPDLSTIPGPKNIDSKFFKIPTYSPVLFDPTGIAWDGDGDIWITGEDVVRFDGANFEIFDSSNSPVPGTGTLTNCIKIDRYDNKWVGIENSLVPLVKFNENKPGVNQAYSVTDFVDSGGNPVCPNAASSIRVIETNPKTGDIFAAFVSNTSPSYDGLLYYSGASKDWYLYTTGNSDIPSDEIRDLRLEFYKLNHWYLWIATDQGLSRFDGVNFKNYDTGNSGLPSNDLYSIELDKLDHKWIGTDNGLVYWDEERWAVWNNATNPELSVGRFTNIVETGNTNIWFVIDAPASPGDNELYFFDGFNFTKVLYRNDGTSLIRPCPNFYGKSALSAPWKTIKEGETTYPRNLILVTDQGEICKIDYSVPHIHATAKFSGTDGWDFVYHETSVPLPAVKYLYNSGIGQSQLYFNFIVGPLYDDITLNSDAIRPVMPSVDRYSWFKPIWPRYSVDFLKDQFPSINLDHAFLYAPLRDILEGKATVESYWRNAQIERIANKKSRDLFENFEWVITLGNSSVDQGVKTTIDNEGDVIVIGDFKDSIFMGEVNNISSQDVYLNTTEQGVFIAKYNKVGVIQWARAIQSTVLQGPIYARSVITDADGNIYVVCDNSLTGFIELNKYNSEGDLISTLNVPVTPDQRLSDVKVDKYENVYITGYFQGTLNLGLFTLSSPSYETGFVAKMDSTLNFVWAKDLTTTTGSKGIEIATLSESILYVTGEFESDIDLGPISLTGNGNPDMFLGKFKMGTGECVWAKSFSGNASTIITEPSITVDPKGHVLLTGSFNGTLEIENQLLTSFPGTYDIFVIKLLSTGKLMWMKMCGGVSGDRSFDIESDSEENVYITGSYSGTAYFSPASINSRGGDDIYLTKFNKDGTLVDIVTAGGFSNDRGSDLILDKEENIYITGYFEGSNADFSPYITASPQGGSLDAFLGKIPKQRFNPGLSIGAIQSWTGSHSWSWREAKFYENEFEIPLLSTVFINPIDSLVPGKKDHAWTLKDTETGETVVTLRNTPYFIWTFVEAGFYSVSCTLKDANGNTYTTEHEGKIRVIDHKEPEAGDLIPEIVNPDDYLLRSIYETRRSLGFPPPSRFQLNEEETPPFN